LEFNGSGDYLTTISAPGAGFIDAAVSDFTVSVWIQLGTVPDGNWRDVFDRSNQRYILRVSNSNYLRVYIAGGVEAIDLFQPVAGVWYHVVITAESTDDTNKKFNIYVNNKLEQTITGVPPALPADTLHIGRHFNLSNSGNNWVGLIDEFAVYGSALSPEAVSTLYNNGTPFDVRTATGNYTQTDVDTLQSYWPFESDYSDLIGGRNLNNNGTTFSTTVPN